MKVVSINYESMSLSLVKGSIEKPSPGSLPGLKVGVDLCKGSHRSIETFKGLTIWERWYLLNLILFFFSLLFALFSFMHQSKPEGFIKNGKTSFLCLSEG